MSRHFGFASAVLAAALFTVPAFAQSGAATTTPATHNDAATNGSNNSTPSNRNPVFTDGGNVRTSKLVGSSVYNDHDTKVGDVNDVLIGKNDRIEVVLSVGGFLGMGTRYVEVPYSRLKLGNTNGNSDNRVVLPGATAGSLKGMSEFHYTNNG